MGIDDISFESSLKNDTLPLFEDCEDEIIEWLENTMLFSECKEHMRDLGMTVITDDEMETSFTNSEKEIC